jgi:hypothetical protein
VSRHIPPDATVFERYVVFEQEHLEIGRRYIQAFGLPRGVGAIVEDMREGRLSFDKARYVLGRVPYLVVEYIVRRVGFTRFKDLATDPEFLALQVKGLARVFMRQGPLLQERYDRVLEDFAWNTLLHWHLVAHDLGGRRRYGVTRALAHVLSQPEVLRQDWDTPRLPVPTLMVRVPPTAGLTLTQRGRSPALVTELYAVEAPAPQRQWSVWLHAPINEEYAETLYIEVPLPAEGSFEQGLALARDVFHERVPDARGWDDCVRWLAAAMRYLMEGGARVQEEPGHHLLLGASGAMH